MVLLWECKLTDIWTTTTIEYDNNDSALRRTEKLDLLQSWRPGLKKSIHRETITWRSGIRWNEESGLKQHSCVGAGYQWVCFHHVCSGGHRKQIVIIVNTDTDTDISYQGQYPPGEPRGFRKLSASFLVKISASSPRVLRELYVN